MSRPPPELITRIETLPIDFSKKAFASALEKGYSTADVPEIYRTARTYKRTRDSQFESDYVHSVAGRDLSGRPVYTAGKEVAPEEAYWYVITIHEDRKSVSED